jgi:hypothetical protein
MASHSIPWHVFPRFPPDVISFRSLALRATRTSSSFPENPIHFTFRDFPSCLFFDILFYLRNVYRAVVNGVQEAG